MGHLHLKSLGYSNVHLNASYINFVYKHNYNVAFVRLFHLKLERGAEYFVATTFEALPEQVKILKRPELPSLLSVLNVYMY